MQSSSGGLATAISEVIIKNEGYVFGVKYSEDFYRAEYCCVNTLEDLNLLKGSKYTESYKGDIYSHLIAKLNEKKPVLFIGLGCDIGAVKNFCLIHNIDTTFLFTIDILCHGPAVKGVHESFVRELEQRYKSRLSYFTIRYKKKRWTPFYIKAEFINGVKKIIPFEKSDYGKAFRYIAKPSCTNCQFKGGQHKGDICLGDYWGIEKGMPGWNEKGVSVIIVQTEKGRELLNMLGDNVVIHEANEELIMKYNPMYWKSRQQKGDYIRFVHELEVYGLHYAVTKLPKEDVDLRERIRKYLFFLH